MPPICGAHCAMQMPGATLALRLGWPATELSSNRNRGPLGFSPTVNLLPPVERDFLLRSGWQAGQVPRFCQRERFFIAISPSDGLIVLLVFLILFENRFSPLVLFEHQFRHDDFPIGAFHEVMKALVGILFTPLYDGRDLAGDKFRTTGWLECF